MLIPVLISLLALGTLATPSLAAQTTVVLDEDFATQAGPFSLGSSIATDPPITTGVNQWLLANSREDFYSDPGHVEFANGRVRLWDHANSANGGYLSLYHEIPYSPVDWQVQVDVYIDEAHFGSRPIPQIYTQADSVRFPGETSRGIQVNTNQMLVFLDPSAPINTNYLMETHVWHTIEIISTPNDSELRAWKPATETRPSLPLASGISLGELRRIFFICPNYQDFDWAVGRVVAECQDQVGPILALDNFLESSSATLSLSNASPNSTVGFAFSVSGPGPTTMAVGACGLVSVDLSVPVEVVAVTTTGPVGTAAVQASVPMGAAGVQVWLQAIDVATCSLSNPISIYVGG